MEEIRDKLFNELTAFFQTNKVTALIKIDHPASGSVIKLNGIALYKILKTPNPFKNSGVAIYRKLSDKAIFEIGGKRAKGKNPWIAAPVTSVNYQIIFKILTQIALNANLTRNKRMRTVIAKIKKEKEVKPKKKKFKEEALRTTEIIF